MPWASIRSPSERRSAIASSARTLGDRSHRRHAPASLREKPLGGGKRGDLWHSRANNAAPSSASSNSGRTAPRDRLQSHRSRDLGELRPLRRASIVDDCEGTPASWSAHECSCFRPLSLHQVSRVTPRRRRDKPVRQRESRRPARPVRHRNEANQRVVLSRPFWREIASAGLSSTRSSTASLSKSRDVRITVPPVARSKRAPRPDACPGKPDSSSPRPSAVSWSPRASRNDVVSGHGQASRRRWIRAHPRRPRRSRAGARRSAPGVG